MSDLLPAIEVETADDPEFAVIWLHGLGADGSDFVPLVPELGLSGRRAVRFVFPHAPEIPVTCNGGYVMRAWYDIISLEATSRRVDEGGIERSRRAIAHLIARENERGIPCERIFIAGFSQGGAVAYTSALSHPEQLAGVIALSTYVPSPVSLGENLAKANRGIAIFAAHGSADEVVSYELGLAARDFLVRNAYRVDWHAYPMGHSVCLDEIKAVGHWLNERLGES